MTAKRSTSARTRRKAKPRRVDEVYQFLIVLSETDPVVWRRIQVPERYTFWDLHVAIQDAMGWTDTHLHEFTIPDPRSGRQHVIGIPDDDFPDDRPRLPGWEVPLTAYFSADQPLALYLYDFGDDWRHVVMLELTWPAEPATSYPRCLAGARVCPPEDCSGTQGYADFLNAIADSGHPEHEQFLTWVGGEYDPDGFRPEDVVFDDPRERWKGAFGG